MSPLLLVAGLVGCAALAVTIYVLLSPRSSGSRLDRLADPPATHARSAEALSGSRDPSQALRASLQSALGSRFERSQRGARLAERLAFASLRLRPLEWIVSIAAVSVAIGALAALRFGSAGAALLGPVLGLLASEVALRVRATRRQRAFDKQLAPTLLSISSGLKAGYTFLQAIDLVSKNSRAPMGAELARVVRETQLGVSQNDALARMTVRNKSDDLKLVHTAVQIQAQVGGNLAQILDTIEFTIRERIRIKGEIKTITAQARVSGYILIALPFALGAILSLVAPTYFTPMLHQTVGMIMLGVGGFFLLCGYLMIRKIVNIRV